MNLTVEKIAKIVGGVVYGDETLKNLLGHSRGIAEECKQFQSFLTGQEDNENAQEEE